MRGAHDRHPRLARLVEGILVVAAFGLVAVLWFAPLFADPGGTVLDPDRPWLSGWVRAGALQEQTGAMLRDIELFVWVYAWNWHALLTQPAAWFQANIFYPAPDALAYSEHAIGTLPITGPLQALTGNPVFAYQGDLLLSFALSGAAMYALLRYVGAGRPAAAFAGLVYAFCPVRRESIFQSYLLAGQWFPLALLFFDRTLVRARWRDAAAFGCCLLLHCLSSYYLAYQALAVLPVCFGLAWLGRRRLAPHGLTRLTLALVGVGAVVAVVSIPYLRVRSQGGLLSFANALPALLPYSNDPWRSWALPTWLLLAHPEWHLVRGTHAYVGLLVAVLAVIGVWRAARAGAAAGRVALAALGIVIVSWVLALGPLLPVGDGTVTLPYALLLRWVPGFDGMRVPYRFALMTMVGMAVLAGLGADALLGRVRGTRRRTAAVALLLVLAATDYGFGMERWPTRPLLAGPRGPKVYHKLATLAPGPTLELPFERQGGVLTGEQMVHSTTHWMPMLTGSSGYEPRSQGLLRRLAHRLPDPRALQLLGHLTGLRYVVLHTFELSPNRRESWFSRQRELRLRYTTGPERIYEVRNPPPPDAMDALQACIRDRDACGTLRAMVWSATMPVRQRDRPPRGAGAQRRAHQASAPATTATTAGGPPMRATSRDSAGPSPSAETASRIDSTHQSSPATATNAAATPKSRRPPSSTPPSRPAPSVDASPAVDYGRRP